MSTLYWSPWLAKIRRGGPAVAGVSLPKLEFILTVFSTWYITFWL